LPWQSLKHDIALGGYRTGIAEAQRKGAPRFGNDNDWNWSDLARARFVNDYYAVAYKGSRGPQSAGLSF